MVAPVDRSHRRSVPSQLPLSANWPSELMTTSWQPRRRACQACYPILVRGMSTGRGKLREALETLLLRSHAPLKAQCRIMHHKAVPYRDVAPHQNSNPSQRFNKVQLRID